MMYEYEYVILMSEKQKEIERRALHAWRDEHIYRQKKTPLFEQLIRVFQKKKEDNLSDDACCCPTC
ncbi:hypothetical protein ACFOU2_21760 [Bacillus songklensis]|uniref:Uncharacterized protein n=1 Tax=Bacillus songklensis TaxID=1069116 RepID=A0ABV8B6L2_9BACI